MGINKVILLGRVGKIETKISQGGIKISYLSFVTDTYFNVNGEKKQISEWHRLIAFGKTAETFEKYVTKGKQMYIEGRLQTRTYGEETDKRYITEIIVNDFQFTDANKKKESSLDLSEEALIGIEESIKNPTKEEVTQVKKEEVTQVKKEEKSTTKFKQTKQNEISTSINEVLGLGTEEVDIPF